MVVSSSGVRLRTNTQSYPWISSSLPLYYIYFLPKKRAWRGVIKFINVIKLLISIGVSYLLVALLVIRCKSTGNVVLVAQVSGGDNTYDEEKRSSA